MTLLFRRAILLIGLLLLASCRQQQLSSADVQLELSASDRRVGETLLLLRVSDRDGKAVSKPGTLSIRGDMDHAGMAPVLAEAESAAEGVFSIPFEWTMGGSWTVEATLTLPNDDVASETFAFEILNEATAADMADMADLADMDHSAIPGSALYLRIYNRGDSDQTLVSASSAAANEVAIHRTVAENDMARMEAVDSIFIPAGETVDLSPGGMHIMLTGLTADLPPGHALMLRLQSDAGETYELEVPVMNMLMSELDDAVAIGDLVFSQRWARPARAGAMAHADMNMPATPAS